MVMALLIGGSVAIAQNDTAELAKKAQNPIASMISVPFQNNFNFGIGTYDRMQYILNIQPVVPFSLNENWNLITRTIVPVVYQPNPLAEEGSASGLSDIQLNFFFAPAKPGKVIWGAGTVFMLPTGTDQMLTQGKWGLGPSIVVLTSSGHWLVGSLINNIWSVGGKKDRADVNQFMWQYFINYNMPKGWYLTSGPTLTANWKAADGEKWTVPFGAGIGKIFRVGKQPMNGQISAYYNAVKPTGASDWSLRFQLQLLFPK